MAVAAFRRASLWPMVRLQTWAEFLKLWRVPAFTLTSLFLPVIFYAFIGVGQSSHMIFQCIPAVFFAALTLVVLFPFAYFAGGVRIDPSVWATLASRVLIGSMP